MLGIESVTAPRVSVVLPVHNGARFIEAAIRSIAGQAFRDFELIVGDDGSDDATPDILRRLKDEFPATRLIRREQKSGLANAANWVASLARADLIAIAHADDLSHPDRLARQVAVMAANPDAVLVGSVGVGIDAHGRRVHEPNLWRCVRPSVFAPIAHSSAMIRRSAFHRTGGYRALANYWEDLDLYWRLAEIGRLLVLPVPLTSYRYSTDSSRERDDSMKVERAIQRMYDHAEAMAHSGRAEVAETPLSARLNPRIFVARSWVHVWTGQRAPVFPSLLRHGRLRFDLASAQALVFVALAATAPRMFRGLLQVLTWARNRAALRELKDLEVIEWRPLPPAAGRMAGNFG